MPISKVTMQAGFTLLEMIIYVAILSLVLLLVGSSLFYFIQSGGQSKGDREVLDNSRRVLEEINYEINGADGIYTPTSTSTQLSLATSRYLPAGESTTYIDFFLCGTRVCMKKEGQNPTFITSDTVEITGLTFNQIDNNGYKSVRTTISLQYKDKNITNGQQPTQTVTSTASLRQ